MFNSHSFGLQESSLPDLKTDHTYPFLSYGKLGMAAKAHKSWQVAIVIEKG